MVSRGNSVGELFLSVLAETDGFAASLSDGVRSGLGEIQQAVGQEVSPVVTQLSENFQQAGHATQEVGKSMSKNITAPLVGLAASALTVGARFDDQMARVGAAAGATGQDFDSLRGVAQELGSTTRFSATEAAEGMEFLAFAGFEVNEIMGAMPALLDVAAVAGGNLAGVSDIVSDTMMAFGIEAKDAGNAADVFAQQFSQSNTSIEQLGEAMKMAAPAAAAAGMSLEETSGVLGVLADSGIKGSMAGTTVTAMLRDMTAAAEDGSISLGDTEVAIFNADGSMRNFTDIISDVNDATVDMTDEQRNAALSSVFQAQSMRGVNLLMGDGVDTLERYTEANYNSAGAASEMADTMEDTLGGQFRALKSQLEGIMIQLSDQLVPIMRDTVAPALARAGEFVSGLISAFSALPGPVQRAIIMALGLLAALGPILIVVGKLMVAVGKLIVPIVKAAKVFATLSKVMLANPIGLVIVAIAALIAAFIWAWNNIDGFREFFIAVWERIKEAAQAVADWFMGTLWPMLQTVWDGIKAGVQALVDWFQGTFVPALQAAWETVSTGAQALWDLMVTVWEGIRNAVGAVVDWFRDHVGPIFTAWFDLVSAVFERFREVTSAVFEAFMSVVSAAWDFFSGIWSSSGEPTVGAISTAFEIFRDVVSAVWDAVVAAVQHAWELIVGVWNAVGEPLLEAIKTGWEILRDAIAVVWEAIRTIVETAMAIIAGVIQAITAAIRGDWSAVWEAIRGIASTVWEAIKTLVTSAITFVQTTILRVMTAIRNVMAGIWTAIRTTVSTTWSTIRSLVSSGINAVRNIIRSVMTAIRNLIRSAWNAAVRLVRTAMTNMRNAVRTGLNNVMTLVRNLPSRIRSAVSNFGTLLLQAGRNVINGLIRGIRERISAIGDAIRDAASTVTRFWPFSPAKEGPLRSNPPEAAGANIVRLLADGMRDAMPDVVREAEAIAAAAARASDMTAPGPVTPNQVEAAVGTGRSASTGMQVTQNIYTVEPRRAAAEAVRKLRDVAYLGGSVSDSTRGPEVDRVRV